MLEPRRTTQATAPLVLEAAPRPPDALGPSEPAIPGPSPAPGAKYKMRSVTTRTFQPSTEPPTSYFSAEPWKIQEREHRAKDESQLFASFRRRTITNIDCQTRRACLPPTPGSIYCQCGGLLLYDAHGDSLLHRKWAAARNDGGSGSTTTVIDDMIHRLRTEPEFSGWSLEQQQIPGTGPGGLNVPCRLSSSCCRQRTPHLVQRQPTAQ